MGTSGFVVPYLVKLSTSVNSLTDRGDSIGLTSRRFDARREVTQT